MVYLIPIILLIVLAGSGLVLFSQKTNPLQQENQKPVAQNTTAQLNPKDCSKNPLAELTEGPYYKTGSPERQKIAEANTPGAHLILKGYVFDTNCKPISNAWLDFWQADGQGNYDNTGYNLRGHQYSDENGFYSVETVVPTRYTGRTEHIHFKVRKSEDSPVLTSQLFFPDSETNSTDSIFDKSLIVDFEMDPYGSKFASFNIIVP